MPKPRPPPTPGSSSDLRGKEGLHVAPVFNLPPTAYQEAERRYADSRTPSINGSDSSYRPASPSTPPESSKKRTAGQASSVITRDDFALPPPPTRSRKIIQMKPRGSEQQDPPSSSVLNNAQDSSKTEKATTGGRKKQSNSNNTAAGRKIARKTAHSLIERRRRSKMNEEFGVLKDMIPACKGQEMHKLAILQASIDYLRYLEQCVTDLKAQKSPSLPRPPSTSPQSAEDVEDEDEEMEDEDEDEEETAVLTPATVPLDRTSSALSLPPLSQITTTTSPPSVLSSTAGRHYSLSSASQASYSPYFHSNQTSPAFGPRLSHAPHSASREVFGLGSPALQPLDVLQRSGQSITKDRVPPSTQPSQMSRGSQSQSELDQEATAALLMLNNDRRDWRTTREGEVGRNSSGMSVKDLLSG